jgi:hypothetical protein
MIVQDCNRIFISTEHLPYVVVDNTKHLGLIFDCVNGPFFSVVIFMFVKLFHFDAWSGILCSLCISKFLLLSISFVISFAFHSVFLFQCIKTFLTILQFIFPVYGGMDFMLTE